MIVRMMRLMVAMLGALGLWSGVASAETGRAELRGTAEGSAISGSAVFTETPEGLQVSVHVTAAPAGKHAIHIHQYGGCGETGNAAGGHFNPDNVAHGFLPKDGLTAAHPGDLGNLEVGEDGDGRLSLLLPGVSMTGGKYAVSGRAVVLHEKPDDFGQPTGNAGGRIGCGPILMIKVLGG